MLDCLNIVRTDGPGEETVEESRICNRTVGGHEAVIIVHNVLVLIFIGGLGGWGVEFDAIILK